MAELLQQVLRDGEQVEAAVMPDATGDDVGTATYAAFPVARRGHIASSYPGNGLREVGSAPASSPTPMVTVQENKGEGALDARHP